MPVGAVVGIGALAGGAQAAGQRSAAKKALKQGSPEMVQHRFNVSNPSLAHALDFQNWQTENLDPYARNIRNIAENPGYIDPSLMNQSLHLSAQRQQSDLNRSMGMIGNSGGMGGIAGAMPLASLSARTMRDVGTHNQYGMMREQLRRSDIEMLEGLRSRNMGMAQEAQGQQAYYAGQVTPWASVLGNAMMGGLAAYGSMPARTPGTGQQPTQSWNGGNAPTTDYSNYGDWVGKNTSPNMERGGAMAPTGGLAQRGAQGLGRHSALPNPWGNTMEQSY